MNKRELKFLLFFILAYTSLSCNSLYGTRGYSDSILESKEKGVFLNEFGILNQYFPDSLDFHVKEILLI